MSKCKLELRSVSGDFHLSGDRVVQEFSIITSDPDYVITIDKIICRAIGQYKYNFNEIRRKISLPELRKSSLALRAPNLNHLNESLVHLIEKSYNDSSHTHLEVTLRILNFLENTNKRKVLQLAMDLPEFIPPNFRGLYFRVSYKVALAIRFTLSKDLQSKVYEKLLQIPLRIFPSTKSYIWPTALISHYEATVSESCITSISLNPRASNPFRDEEFGPVEEETNYSIKSKAHSHAEIIPSNFHIAPPPNETSNCNSANTNRYNSSILAELCNSSAQGNFFISNSKGRVVRLCLSRTTFLVGSEIRGFFDFTASQVPCTCCTIRLLYCETFTRTNSKPNTPNGEEDFKAEKAPLVIVSEEYMVSNMNPKKPDPSAHLTIVESKKIGGCITHRIHPFTLQIPFSVQPQFAVKNRHIGNEKVNIMHSLSWYLQVELQCAGCTSVNMTRTVDKPLNSVTIKFPLIDSNGKNIPIETLEWSLPIRLFPPTASAVHFPPEDTRTSITVVPDF